MRRKLRWLVTHAGLAVMVAASAHAQRWQVVTPDSAWSVRAPSSGAVVDSLVGQGYFAARVDSLVTDTMFVTPGARAVVESVDILGALSLDIGRGWRTQAGEVLRLEDVQRDVNEAAAQYAAAGFLDAVLTPRIDVVGERALLTVQVDEGGRQPIVGVELAGGRSPARAFASRRAGVEGATPIEAVDPRSVQRALDATGLYTSVGDPVLARDAQGDLVLQVPVVEAPPGTFDLVLGYLPPTGTTSGSVVGRGRVDLRNPLGGGRTAFVEIERTPGLASSFSVAASDPFVAGTPIGVGAAFIGSSRDSTLSRQRLAVDARYGIEVGLDVVATLARETVRPGTFGAREVDGRPRVRATEDVLVGVGVVLTTLDQIRNPRRGVELTVIAEQGRRAGTEDVGGPSSRRRFVVDVRGFIPTVRRQALAVGLDGTVTQQRVGPDGLVDEGDLVRFGGAASFRGYDEDVFLARSYGRALAEYRVLFDDVSYAFAFTDAGAFDRPPTPDLDAERRFLLGYGAGLRLRTGIGVATVTYALNPDLGPGEGKVHVGLTVGL